MRIAKIGAVLLSGLLIISCETGDSIMKISGAQITETSAELVKQFGQQYEGRINTGVRQVAVQWRSEDGTAVEFDQFCRENFVADESELIQISARLEHYFESINGHLTELGRELRWHQDVNTGPLLPIDDLIGNLSLDSHLGDDLYSTKVAFFVLLNYPVLTLEESLAQGDQWTRQKWAEVRLAQKFSARVPAEVSQAIHNAYINSDNYISGYNIQMGNLLTSDGRRLFPKDLRLISHWGIRDELKAQYGFEDGFEKQELIYSVMERIIRQEVPQSVIDNPDVDWTVMTNQVAGETGSQPEPDTRYRHLGNNFRAQLQADPFYPDYPNNIDRSFSLYREISVTKIRSLFTTLLSSEEFQQTAGLVKKHLGRDLEPFDIWFNGFRNSSAPDQNRLDKIPKEKYPTAASFRADIPNILVQLDFHPRTAEFLRSKIDVDASRGVGHAMGAGRRSDNAHLRTRVEADGMSYKGYNIAVHELGHNVEQVFSLNRIDHPLLEGVPNTAFTEAFAFVFQSRNLELLGINNTTDVRADNFSNLQRLWSLCEIAAIALVDIDVWQWMYANPDFSDADLKAAVIEIARDNWNKYFYPVMGHKDAIILGIYSHMIDNSLYLANYPLGHIIEFQVEEYMRGRKIGPEMERMCKIGNVTPDLWMNKAVGESISVEPILTAARASLERLK